VLDIPERLSLMSVTALGHPGDTEALNEDFRSMELAPRSRTPLQDLAHAGRWGSQWKASAGAGWEARYRETPVEQLPWFHSGLDADITRALDALNPAPGRALDLGCGPGTQAVALARSGFDVTASDISWSAIEAAQKLAEAEGVDIAFHVDDILNSRIDGPFDLVIDRGVFHCFAENPDQQAYLTTVRRLLSPGGILLLKCFHRDETREQGPPGRYDENDIHRFFANGFELIEARESRFASPAGEDSPKALFCILKRR
jgi:SAM-dependent methyltransferase